MKRTPNRTEPYYGWQSADTKDPLSDAFRERPVPSKKNRKRWCRGKVGVEHTPEIVLDERYANWPKRPTCGWSGWRVRRWGCFHLEVCTKCGKHLDPALGKRCPDYPGSAVESSAQGGTSPQ